MSADSEDIFDWLEPKNPRLSGPEECPEYQCGGCSCHINPPCSHCTDHLCKHEKFSTECEECSREEFERESIMDIIKDGMIKGLEGKIGGRNEEEQRGIEKLRDEFHKAFRESDK